MHTLSLSSTVALCDYPDIIQSYLGLMSAVSSHVCRHAWPSYVACPSNVAWLSYVAWPSYVACPSNVACPPNVAWPSYVACPSNVTCPSNVVAITHHSLNLSRSIQYYSYCISSRRSHPQQPPTMLYSG